MMHQEQEKVIQYIKKNFSNCKKKNLPLVNDEKINKSCQLGVQSSAKLAASWG